MHFRRGVAGMNAQIRTATWLQLQTAETGRGDASSVTAESLDFFDASRRGIVFSRN